jgi:hypothetical protein
MPSPVHHTWLVHGEPDGANALRDALLRNGKEVTVAKLGDEVEI